MKNSFRITNKMLVEGELEARDLSKKASAYYNGTDVYHIIVMHPDMVWSKETAELNDEEKALLRKLRKDMKENAR